MISRGNKGLTERYRPQLFSEVIGQEKLIAGIRNRWSKGKRPTAVMFSGDTGNGKTTLARIISVAVNCEHQSQFGEPCKECRKQRQQFDIVEINAADVRGVGGIRDVIDGWQYEPQYPAKMRVYILDEAHGLLTQSQRMLLKPFEDGPDTTLWIICTTEPNSIIKTLRGRCVHWPIPLLSLKNTQKLVRDVIDNERKQGRIEQEIEEDLLERFLDALGEQQVFQPRLILNNLETFLTTLDPDCVVGVSADDTVAAGKFVLNGNWDGLRHQMEEMDGQQIEGMRRGVLAYLRKVLLNTKRSAQATRLSQSVKEIAAATNYEEAIASALIMSALYDACRRFGQ